MIRVDPAPEPDRFDADVRQPGLNAIALRVGEPPVLPKRKGPPIQRVADRREDLERKHFPAYWQEVIPELATSYRQICAYSCLYIRSFTGNPTVDHFAALSHRWDRIYEWNNYRLACSRVNGRKSDFSDVMDPFEVEEGFFALDLVALKVVPGPRAGFRIQEIRDTIQRLGLDGPEYKADLEDYWEEYESGLSLKILERRAPFYVSEMRRQKKLRPGDV